MEETYLVFWMEIRLGQVRVELIPLQISKTVQRYFYINRINSFPSPSEIQ